MRTLLMMLILAGPAFGQVRTWTIATGVYTAEAELIAIRGDTAYLKMGDQLETVPLARLSAADHEFIRSLSLAPVRTEPGAGGPPADDLPTPLGPSTGNLPAPASTPAVTEEAIPLPPAAQTGQGVRGASSRSAASGQSAAVRGSGRSNAYRTASSQARGATNTTARRMITPSNQLQTAPRGDSNSNSGILGIRERRAERQRGR